MIIKKSRTYIALLISVAIMVGVAAPIYAATLGRTDAADYIIWKASTADMNKTEGDTLDTDSNLKIGCP